MNEEEGRLFDWWWQFPKGGRKVIITILLNLVLCMWERQRVY